MLQMRDDVQDEESDVSASSQLADLGQQLVEKKEELDAIKEEKKRIQKEYDRLREEVLPQAMTEAGIVSEDGRGSYTLPDGSTVYLRSTLYASCPKAQREQLHQWLRSRGHGDLIKESVHHQTLRAFAREQVEKGEEVPEFMTTHYVTRATVRN